ncbi:hypothetical protein [Mycobacterium hubeiense]|uniref:hypothetical protein n=1 Tax=Mycobacterium hubeiense TaxID=1867256 RepID=UPI001303FB2C|nr:hypothetical protein [Mycobacterium sp. QGD 101]
MRVVIDLPDNWQDTPRAPSYVNDVASQLAQGYLSGYVDAQTHWAVEHPKQR